MPTGQCPTGGVGGFTLGGGLSTFSRSFGLAIDNVLALTIVTAEGKILNLTSSEKDPSLKSLSWALVCGGA
jgi:FAD/FMN-containing dehydrogenase